MAAEDPAAKRYALAAFSVAQEKGDLDGWRSAIEQIADFMSMPAVQPALENSRVPVQAKMSVIEQSLTGLPQIQLNFARLLVQKGRVGLAREIANQFIGLVEEAQSVVRASAKTAVPLSDAERETLLQRLRERTGRQVVLVTEVDPQLLGGVVIQIGDELIDASTRTRLIHLKQRLVGAV